MLRAELSAALDRERRLELRIAELERRLGMDSSNSGTPGSKEPIGAKERRKAERRDRNTSERERRKDRKRGGQPGHPGAGLSRDRDPDERKTADSAGGVLGVRGEPGRGECSRLVVGAGLGREDRPVGDRVAAAVAAVPVLREADDRGRAAGRVPGHHFVRGGDQRGRGAAERVRERAVRARRPPDRDAAGRAGLPGLRGPGQRPAGREAPGRGVRRRDAGRPYGRAGARCGRDPGQRADPRYGPGDRGAGGRGHRTC